MIHTKNCTQEEIKLDNSRIDHLDERGILDDGYYAFTRKELLHNLIMVYQSAFTSGKFGHAIRAIHLYGKEVGMFQKRKAYPLCTDDLTYPEIQNFMTSLVDSYPEDDAKMETQAVDDFKNASAGRFDFTAVSQGITPDDYDQEQARHSHQDSNHEKHDPVAAQAIDQFTAGTGDRCLQRPQRSEQSELSCCKSQVAQTGQIDKESGSTHPASNIFNSDGGVQHGQTVANDGHHNKHEIGYGVQDAAQQKSPKKFDFADKGGPQKSPKNGDENPENVVNSGNFSFGEANFQVKNVGHIIDHGIRQTVQENKSPHRWPKPGTFK